MAYLLLAALSLFAAYPFLGATAAIWVLAGGQLALLVGEIRKGQVSGAGAFIFMSFLFFSVRPIYVVLEKDYNLLIKLFRVRTDLEGIGGAMWWGSAALLCFAIGAFIAPKVNRRWLLKRKLTNAAAPRQALVSAKVCYGMMFVQLLTLPIMYVLASGGRGLYSSGLGAYAYDLPVPLQAIHIITLVAILERYLRIKTPSSLAMLVISAFLFLDFTWLMREVSMFRGFYVAGVMIAGIAVLQRIKGRVGYAWLIIPIVAVQPFFQYLGETRNASNAQLEEEGVVEAVLEDRTLVEAYWSFYDSRGDMNIFDTFVAAQKSQPAFYPYVWSWIYAPLHFIPRKLWSGKPEKGITQDLRFMRGAPYCPGIAGFFLLDGGLIWMLLSMLALGFLVSLLDAYVFTMPPGYLKYCLVGILCVNAMFLTRAFLWFYFWQLMYAIVPIVVLAWLFGRKSRIGRARASNQRRSMGEAAI
jgi:hypothetical protein